MWLQLLSMVGKPIVGYFAKRAERRHILAKMDALTEGELKLGKHDIDVIRTRAMKSSIKDEIFLCWLLIVYSFPFLPAVFVLFGGDLGVAKASAQYAEMATRTVFGDNAGTIMGSVVVAVFGLSRLMK